MKNIADKNQMRWVVLLLAAAVILPTVCLLWFMTQAVKNERLAVRQKLVDVYQEKTRPLVEQLEKKRLEFEQSVEQADQLDAFAFFQKFCCDAKEYADAVLIYDINDRMLFPTLSNNTYSIDTENFGTAWKLEFTDSNYVAAAKEYERVIMPSSIPDVVFYGQLAITRCYEKSGNLEKAISVCRELAYPGQHIVNEYTPSDMIRARLKLAELYRKTDTATFEKEAAQLLSDLMDAGQKKQPASETRVFVLGKLLEMPVPFPKADVTKAKRIIDAQTLSLQAANRLDQAALDKWKAKTISSIDLHEKLYGILFKTRDKKIILAARKSSITDVMKYMADKLADSAIEVSVLDDQGAIIGSEHRNAADAFLTIRPSTYFDEWKLCFFFRDSGVFDQAARRQETLYVWTGTLVILFMFVITGVGGSIIARQARLNKLKNDFIATISHELRTPLASMRVLVDTLLEGRYKDQQQVREYLELASKENARLSRLIDNFLTFSRMERNKQAFDLVPTNPADIAKTAVEAVQAKFKLTTNEHELTQTKLATDFTDYTEGKKRQENTEKSKIVVTISDDLPSILADKDAMVTVLVNLLDNAYKYSYDDKQIELCVFAENNLKNPLFPQGASMVCFAVKDNGIGMTRRQMRKIFDKFYQVDQTLARKAEGCGLGLSIVKFIVDAHHGKIEVESKPNKGSAFIVRLPV